MEVRCGCKINLSLKVVGHTEDGFHLLDTIFYPLAKPYDILRISENHGDEGIEVWCDVEGIDVLENTLTKAYREYAAVSNFSPSLAVELVKGIPHGAGLGGGSSDAGGLLLYLQGKNKNPLSFGELVHVASRVGADVPFFLYNKPCHGMGIGDVLRPRHVNLKGKYIVLVSSDIHINTAWAFREFDAWEKTLKDKSVLASKNPISFPKMFCMENDFEAVIFKTYPLLSDIKNILLRHGAFVAMMSGSGSIIYGLFDSFESAHNVCKVLEKIQENNQECTFQIMKPYML